MRKFHERVISYASSLFLSFNSSVSTVPFWNGGSVEYAIRFASDSDLEKISELANRTLDPKDPDFNNQYHELNLTFHLSIARLTRNTYLISALENVFNRLRRDLLIDGRSNLENSLDMHIQLAAAMKRRDLEQAHRITADQIDFVEKRLYLH